MMARCKKILLANVFSMSLQIALLGLLCLWGIDTLAAVGISKTASWFAFGLQLLLAK